VHYRLRHVPPSRSTSTATGLFLGWTMLVSTVADAVRRGTTQHGNRHRGGHWLLPQAPH
jgi:hypothetical protein